MTEFRCATLLGDDTSTFKRWPLKLGSSNQSDGCQDSFLNSQIPCVHLIPEKSTLFSLFIPQEVTKATGLLSFPVEDSLGAMGPLEAEPFPDRVNSF